MNLLHNLSFSLLMKLFFMEISCKNKGSNEGALMGRNQELLKYCLSYDVFVQHYNFRVLII